MTDMEKVISDVISAFDDWENNRCCPGEDWSDVHQSRDMVIALLKAQEPRVIKNSAGIGICPGCGHIIPAWSSPNIIPVWSSPNYCGYCGQAVKWE